MTTIVEIEVVTVRRYRCPHCRRTRSSQARTAEHLARCWRNPAARGCKTCAHYEPGDSADYATGYPGFDESCGAGISLAGRPACGNCGGCGDTFDGSSGGVSACQECGGDGAEVKPGPVVGCHEWEPRP